MSLATCTRSKINQELGIKSQFSNRPRNLSSLRAAQMIIGSGGNSPREDCDISRINQACTSFSRYDDDMYGNNTIQTSKLKELEQVRNFSRFSNKYRASELIPHDWERQTLNSNANYLESPTARHQERIGSTSPEKHLTRKFNRKMKMHDSFVTIFPSYTHEPKTVFTYA